MSGVAVGVVAGLAKAICPNDSVSPRLALMPTALVTAARSAGIAVAGTDLSTSTATVWRLTWPGSDHRVRDGLVDAVLGVRSLVVVVGSRATRAGLRVGRDVPGGTGCPAGGAAAREALRLELLGQRDALAGVLEPIGGGLVGVQIGVDLHLRLAGAERLGEHR